MVPTTTRRAALLARLWAGRVANPLRRFGVILRYEGVKAAWEASLARLQELRPLHPRPPGDTTAPARPAPCLPHGSRDAGRPAVSVIVRTCNRPALLRQALRSLAAQTYDDFEVLVIDDGEVDIAGCLKEAASGLSIRTANHLRGSGRGAALNSGLAAARGRWITYLDDDDVVYPQHLAHLVAALDGQPFDVIYSQAVRALCRSDLTLDVVVGRTPCVSRKFDRRALLVDNWIPLMTFIHRAECASAVGGFDASLSLFEDWDFLIRLSDACRFAHVPVATCEYRYRFGPMPANSRSALRERESVLKATRQIYARYPVDDAESRARRQLTLHALAQDVVEARWVLETVSDPLERDLRIVARAGRFHVPRQPVAGWVRPWEDR